uniref:Uncharacterized protein n=1 Tax=Bionectria ochroleuca TaxID=29856 RepID=A0A8H7TTQ4_BIOOC
MDLCLECNVHLDSIPRLTLQAWSERLSLIRTIRKQGSVTTAVSLYATLHVACTCASQKATPVSSLHHTPHRVQSCCHRYVNLLITSQPSKRQDSRRGLLVSSTRQQRSSESSTSTGRGNVYIGLPIQQRTTTSHKDKNWWAAVHPAVTQHSFARIH